ncbi:ATP-dependent RNA helicase dhx29-like [Lytechinus pictus]|uniref:ATP-dependent RNA helicase dhx29-like n=1 Tax=Lytechinus pictus TaxID=7653 RepID=UPI0030B9F2F2
MGKKKKNISRPISTESTAKGNTGDYKVPKKYAFDSTRGASASEDVNGRSVKKVILPADEEHVIISEILKYKEANDSGSTVSGRLTNKKLTDLYNALEDVGFKHNQICDSMRSTVSYGGDLHSALDWLCLNLTDDQLPSGFTEKYVQDEAKKKDRAKFIPEDEEKEKKGSNTSGHKNKEKKVGNNQQSTSSKEWTIQRYAEISSDDDDGLKNDGQPDSWKREPNEYYKELKALISETQTRATEAKMNGDKKKKKEASEMIQNFVQIMAEVEQHPLFDPKVKVQERQLPEPQHHHNAQATSCSGVDDDDAGTFALFDAMEAEAESAPLPTSESSTEKKAEAAAQFDVRDFSYTNKVWTGKSPKQFLIDWCRKNFPKSNPPKYQKIKAHENLWRCKLTVDRPKQEPLVFRTEILTENAMEAQHLASVHAFWYLAKGQSIHQLLPPPYRDVWLEWMDAEVKEKEETTERKNKPRDQFVGQLLKQIKSSQSRKNDVAKLPNKREERGDEDEEEVDSWEDAWDDDDDDGGNEANERDARIEPNQRKGPVVTDRTLKKILEKNANTTKHQRLLEDRKTLPVFQHRDEVLERVHKDSIVIVAGETGSGKSTQIPQFLLEDRVLSGHGGSCNIVCTQPRRISATSLAKRVSQELGEAGPGLRDSLCGYQIRLESRQTKTTRLLYCTTGVLLRKLQLDPSLKDVSHIIIDEVHERSVQSDFLMIIVRKLVQQRSDLKLILMSATLDSQKLSAYFYHCPIISIPGRTYQVKVHHLEDVVEDTGYQLESDSRYALRYESLAQEDKTTVSVTTKGGNSQQVQLSWETNDVANLDESGLDVEKYSKRTRQVITRLNPDTINMDLILELLSYLEQVPLFQSVEGAVLIFMPGLAQIQQLYELLQADPNFSNTDRYILLALHSVLSSDDQSTAFTVPPPGVRKIVIATNIAETGITIPDVVFVIDAGRVKENRYNERSQMSSLEEMYVSKASAKQRQGRAGRVREGFCFRLYTKQRYDGMRSFTQPEIQRVALEELCLHIMKCSLGNPEDFLQAALDPPLPQAVRASMSLLREVGACLLDTPTLTPLGQHLAALPVNVRIGKMLLFAAIFGCLEPVAVIASAMTDKPPFLVPLGKRSLADAAKRSMSVANSDHITIYKAYSGWKEAQSKGRSAESKYCHVNFLSRTALLNMENVKRDLMQLVKSIGFIPSTTNQNTPNSSLSAKQKSLSSKMEVLDISKTESSSGYKDVFPLTTSNTALLKAVLTAGLYPNVAKTTYEPPAHGMKDDEIICRADTTKGPVTVHPSSVNRQLGTNGWMLFSERVKLSKVYIRESSLITPYPLLLFGGEIAVHHREGFISIDDWIKFQASAKTAVIFKELRLLLNVFLEKKLASPALQIQDEEVIKALLKLLKSEKAR